MRLRNRYDHAMSDVDTPATEAEPDPQPAPPARPAWFVPVLIAAGVVVLAILAVVAVLIVNAVTPHTFAASGTLSVNATGFLGDGGAGLPNDGDACHATGGYTDISPGTEVVVTDDAGKTVAVGQLGAGKVTAAGLACAFPFKVSDIPAGSKFYKVEISHRGGLQYTEQQLRSRIDLSLG